MIGLNVRTFAPKPGDIQKNWYVIDATDVVLGRLATQIANILRGKNKATYAPNADGGDFVIVINAEKVALSGNKREAKMAYRHSGFPGGLRATAYGELLDKKPELAIEKAVRGMLPITPLGRTQLQHLKVYRGAQHPHSAQKPVPYEIVQVSQQPR
jgi:large subunit ribosomal protein L13